MHGIIKFIKQIRNASSLAGVFLCVSIFYPHSILAKEYSLSDALSEAESKQLFNSVTWQRLTFLENKPNIISEEFYLSKEKSKKDEMMAMIRLIFKDKTTFCKYPARVYWLSTQLESIHTPNNCLDTPNTDKNISIVQVSGYLKNPASTFGHSLINIISSNNNRLVNESLNFGAKIPEGENAILYALKGVSGIYEANFKKTDFFKNDVIYSKNEQRDMWEFVLNLTETQKKLLIYHLHELQQHKFKYYFLKQNCGYRTGELIELITETDFTNNLLPWYAPDTTFQEILAYQKDKNTHFIKEIRFIPSAQSLVYAQFNELSPSVQSLISSSIRTKKPEGLNDLDTKTKIKSLDFIIQYINYKDPTQNDKNLQSFKRVVISERFLLPRKKTENQPYILKKQSPAFEPRPSRAYIEIKENEQIIGLSAFNRTALNTFSPLHSEIKALDIKIKKTPHTTKIKSATLINLLQISDVFNKLPYERKYSWQLNAGIQEDHYAPDKTIGVIGMGIGIGNKIGNNGLIYSLIGSEFKTNDAIPDITLRSALLYKKDHFGVKLINTIRARKHKKNSINNTLTLKWGISKNSDIRISQSGKSTQLEASYFF